MVTLTFLGGAGTVTGSKTLIETAQSKWLVDCGMFQGEKSGRLRNREPLSVPASDIDGVLITHAHLDHCGWLPCLVAQGFEGPIYASAPTLELLLGILYDSAKIQEEEAEKANAEGYTRHQPALPLYDTAMVDAVKPLLKALPLHKRHRLGPDLEVELRYAGHILGACSLMFWAENQRILFSGDIGRQHDILLHAPEAACEADVIVMESTYGDRLHPATDPKPLLAHDIRTTLEQGGSVIIPSFAVERAQSLLWLLNELQRERALPQVPVILDSPMGLSVLATMRRYPDWQQHTPNDWDRVEKACTPVRDYQEHLQWVRNPQPKIVIAASGMASGGRVLDYLNAYLPQPQHKVILAGYQAEATRGRQLLDGAPEVKIYGHWVRVHAQVIGMDHFSAHADQNDLMQWALPGVLSHTQLILMHGEAAGVDGLSKAWAERGHQCIKAVAGMTFTSR